MEILFSILLLFLRFLGRRGVSFFHRRLIQCCVRFAVFLLIGFAVGFGLNY